MDIDKWKGGRKEKSEGENKRERNQRRQASCIGYFRSHLDKSEPVSSPTSQSPTVLCIFSVLSLSPTPRLKMLVLFYSSFPNPFIKLTNQESNPSFSTVCLNLSTAYYSFCTSNLEFAPKLLSNLTNQSPIFGLFYSLPTEKLISLEKS